MDRLELEASMEPIHPRVAIDVHRVLQLSSHKIVGLGRLYIGGHGKVTDCDLDVNQTGRNVRDEEINQHVGRRRQGLEQQKVPYEEETHAT